MTTMKTHFLKIQTTWSPKNKLALAIKEEILKLDKSVYSSLDEAMAMVMTRYTQGIENYKGHCKIEKIHDWITQDGTQMMQLDGVFQIAIYEIAKTEGIFSDLISLPVQFIAEFKDYSQMQTEVETWKHKYGALNNAFCVNAQGLATGIYDVLVTSTEVEPDPFPIKAYLMKRAKDVPIDTQKHISDAQHKAFLYDELQLMFQEEYNRPAAEFSWIKLGHMIKDKFGIK